MLVCKQTPKNNVQLVHRPSENATNYLKEFDLIKELTPRCITAVFGSAYRFMPTPCADHYLSNFCHSLQSANSRKSNIVLRNI